MWLTRLISSVLYLFAIIFTIPLAFDVGGRTCGLAFSLALSCFYFFYSALQLSTPHDSRFRWVLGKIIAASQWIIIPTLLIWSLNKFSVDSDNSSGWVEKTLGGERAESQSVREWFFGKEGIVENITIGGWDKLLRWSTPVFQLSEGFCSLLVIQAAGQITRYLVNGEGGDGWMIGLLITSASIISTSVYFLWRITTFPEIGNIDAVLIGIAITCAFFLCAWGIGSGRGNPVESSLLFAYMTLCIYQIFTDYQPSHPVESTMPLEPDFPPLPPIIMASYSTLMHALSTLPSTIHSAFSFLVAAIMTITPSVIISLAYRLFVMYASARIIPAVRDSGARALSQEPSLDDNDGVGQVLGFLSYFSPSILIAVYTSLLMQHFASASTDHTGEWWTSQGGDAGSSVWRWANLAGTLVLYAVELYLGKGHDDSSLTSHWKVD
ncbi:hypothetical protein AAFC00_002602 [Neodothiora populina]|uniref:ER membrane protein n=1 Tax=Neodothiora populina TaxID=2781224 RepID=A0ABR3P7L3_9PEZI